VENPFLYTGYMDRFIPWLPHLYLLFQVVFDVRKITLKSSCLLSAISFTLFLFYYASLMSVGSYLSQHFLQENFSPFTASVITTLLASLGYHLTRLVILRRYAKYINHQHVLATQIIFHYLSYITGAAIMTLVGTFLILIVF
jgi:hypothetical protein